MPADSDPQDRPVDVPVRFRPLGVRIAATALALTLLLFATVIWLTFPAEVRASFTLMQRATLVLVAVLLGAIGYALGRCRVDASETGLTVVNGYRTHRFEWPQVVAAHLPRGAPWAVLDLADGTTTPAMAIQGSDGDRARRALRELRSALEQQHGTPG